MGKIVYNDDKSYQYVSDNGVVYELYEGVTLDKERSSDIVFIMLSYVEELNVEPEDEYVGFIYGNDFLTSRYKEDYIKCIDRIVDDYEINHPEVVSYYVKKNMPKNLKKMLSKFSELTQCGGIRSYYDSESPELFRYADSSEVFNMFCMCEEVVSCLMDGNINKAESIINYYKNKDNVIQF